MKCSIYILGLKDSKYYVGRSSNIERRVIQHHKGSGSSWTRKYPVNKLLRVYKNCDPYDEDKYTLKLMDKYGIENVRGGSYVLPELSEADINSINRRIRMATDRCVNCGSKGHFVSKCKTIVNDTPEEYSCEICMVNDHTTMNCPHF